MKINVQGSKEVSWVFYGLWGSLTKMIVTCTAVVDHQLPLLIFVRKPGKNDC